MGSFVSANPPVAVATDQIERDRNIRCNSDSRFADSQSPADEFRK